MEAVEDDEVGISLDDGTAWLIDGWNCDACTLRNEPTAHRCSACDRLRHTARQRNSSGVVVVLPPDESQVIVSRKRRHEDTAADTVVHQTSKSGVISSGIHVFNELPINDDSWVCPACTLLNAEDVSRCVACSGVRWALPGRSVAAAALRAAGRNNRHGKGDAVSEGTSGIRREVGPNSTWTALPPAPEGHLERSCAADDGLDMFASVEVTGETTQTQIGENAEEMVDRTKSCVSEELARPQWGAGDKPLFAGLDVRASVEPTNCDVEFDDAVARLSLMGFDPTKCHLALEAANGDESLARDFLIREV